MTEFTPPLGWEEMDTDVDGVKGWTDGTYVLLLATVEQAIELDWIEQT